MNLKSIFKISLILPIVLTATPSKSMSSFKTSFMNIKNTCNSFKTYLKNNNWNISQVQWDEDLRCIDSYKPKKIIKKPFPLKIKTYKIRQFNIDDDIETIIFTEITDPNKKSIKQPNKKSYLEKHKMNKLAKNMTEEYEKSVLSEVKNFKSLNENEFKKLPFDKQVAQKTMESVNKTIKETTQKKYGKLTTKNVQNTMQSFKNNPEIKSQVNEIRIKLQKNGYKKILENCYNQKNRTNCISKIKKMTQNHVGNIYGGIRGKAKFAIDYTNGTAIQKLTNRSIASILAGHPSEYFSKDYDSDI